MKNLFNELDINIKKKLRNISLIVLDFDGVITNNRVIHNQNGIESVSRSKGDSLAVDLLDQARLYNKNDFSSMNHPIDIVILSRESNLIVKAISEKIKIKCKNPVYAKLPALRKEARLRNVTMEKVLFIGNDINDIECIKKAGIGIAVADSCSQVIRIADYVTLAKGGEGAFREISEFIMYAKKVHPFP